jgi:hypothetical protein
MRLLHSLAAVVLLGGGVTARDATARLCVDVLPGEGHIKARMKNNIGKLSADCADAFPSLDTDWRRSAICTSPLS